MREDDTVFEEVKHVSDVKLDRYAVVFIDDSSYDDETKRVLAHLMIRKKVLLANSDVDFDLLEDFDEVVKKPFLPSQIRTVLKGVDERESMKEEVETHSIFPLASEKDPVDENQDINIDKTKVLDTDEIEKIKALLDMDEEVLPREVLDEEEIEARKVEVIKQQLEADGLEIISEEEYVETLSSKVPKKEKKKSKKRDSKKSKETQLSFEETLLKAVKGMKMKKIKKLLKGAEVTIQINFKDKK
jgi:HD superfamily phosphohydrolase